MRTDELVEEVKREEGFVAKVYLDTKGKQTIGYGTLLEDGITEAEAELLLRHRLGPDGRRTRALLASAMCTRIYRPNAQRAVLNMAYNMGVPSLLGFKRMWAALREGDYEGAAAEALDSDYARELPARAGRVAGMMRSA